MLMNKRQVFLFVFWIDCSLLQGWKAGARRRFWADTRCSTGARGKVAVEGIQKAGRMSEDAAEPVRWVIAPYERAGGAGERYQER